MSFESSNGAQGANKADPLLLSSRDQHRRTFSNEENLLEEDGDDVFSNPDTAELESSRSDATGATSPTPNSPGPSSPSNRATSHIAIVASSSQPKDPFGTLKQPDYQSSVQPKHQPINPLMLANLPSTNVSQLNRQFEQDVNVETPKANNSSTKTFSRPQMGRTLSASGATMHSTQQSMHSSNSTSRILTPSKGGHASSHSASYLNLSLAHGQPLPSAHDMPSDPRKASTVSKLFARPPAQSPSEEICGFGLGVSDGMTAGTSRSGPNTPVVAPSLTPLSSRLRSRPTTRPSSPDHTSSPSRGASAGLGMSNKAYPEADAHEPSIFERDIEHRDAGHVLSKQEALDVAIPSVLDDAVEAITCEDADQVEVVAPHAAPPPLALSAQALSAHSHSHSRLQNPETPSASSPARSLSPPLSSAGGAAGEAPPGSMAAQIAERLASKMGTSTSPDEMAGTASMAATTSRHRRPNSDVSVSSSSSLRSRSPHVPLSIGVQQVLDASNSPPPVGTSNLRSIPASPVAGQGHSKPASTATTPRSGSTSHANLTSLISPSAASPKPTTPLPTATALPSLPLPNPYRSHSPTTSTLPLTDAGVPMLSTVSMDGAIMPTNETATMGASLDGLADVIAASQSNSGSSTLAMASPASFKIKGLGFEEDLSPYSSRSPAVGTTASARMSEEKSMPGGLSLGLNPSDDPTGSPQTTRSNASSTTAKKRLSFFSYADIINQTPAEVLDLDTVLRQADSSPTSMARSISADPRWTDGKMTESPVQVEIATAPAAHPSTSTSGSNPARRSTSLKMSARTPGLKLILSSDEQADFSAAVQRSREGMSTDASILPASTNMGGHNKPAPANRAQPVGKRERAMIPTEQENEKASRDAYAASTHSWEEDDVDARPAPRIAPSNAVYLQAIPCLYVENVKSATSFYKDILGFQVLGKPDTTHATLFRPPPQAPSTAAKGAYSGKMSVPPNSVQVYLRISPMGPDGVRVKPPAVTLWMLVNDVDEVFKEMSGKWTRFQPKDNEYFPTHLFGDARIMSKPQNKAWGNRELHVIDGDDNKIIFFKHLH